MWNNLPSFPLVGVSTNMIRQLMKPRTVKPKVSPSAAQQNWRPQSTAQPVSQQSLMDVLRQMGTELGLGSGTNPYGNDMLAQFNNRAQAIVNQLSQSPDFNPLRRYVEDDLTRQQAAATGGVTMAFDKGSAESREAAKQASADGRAEAAAQQALYRQAAADLAAENRSAASGMSNDYGALGVSVGEVSPEALAIQAELTASAPREAAMARNIGNIAANAQNEYASSMQNQKIAEIGSLGRAISNLKAQSLAQINNQDIGMQQAARQAAMQAALNFQNQAMEMEIAKREWDSQQQNSLRDFVMSGVVGEIERRGGVGALMGAGANGSQSDGFDGWGEYTRALEELRKAEKFSEAVALEQIAQQIIANPGIDYATALSSISQDQLAITQALRSLNSNFNPDLAWWVRQMVDRRGTPQTGFRLGVGGR